MVSLLVRRGKLGCDGLCNRKPGAHEQTGTGQRQGAPVTPQATLPLPEHHLEHPLTVERGSFALRQSAVAKQLPIRARSRFPNPRGAGPVKSLPGSTTNPLPASVDRPSNEGPRELGMACLIVRDHGVGSSHEPRIRTRQRHRGFVRCQGFPNTPFLHRLDDETFQIVVAQHVAFER